MHEHELHGQTCQCGEYDRVLVTVGMTLAGGAVVVDLSTQPGPNPQDPRGALRVAVFMVSCGSRRRCWIAIIIIRLTVGRRRSNSFPIIINIIHCQERHPMMQQGTQLPVPFGLLIIVAVVAVAILPSVFQKETIALQPLKLLVRLIIMIDMIILKVIVKQQLQRRGTFGLRIRAQRTPQPILLLLRLLLLFVGDCCC